MKSSKYLTHKLGMMNSSAWVSLKYMHICKMFIHFSLLKA